MLTSSFIRSLKRHKQHKDPANRVLMLCELQSLFLPSEAMDPKKQKTTKIVCRLAIINSSSSSFTSQGF